MARSTSHRTSYHSTYGRRSYRRLSYGARIRSRARGRPGRPGAERYAHSRPANLFAIGRPISSRAQGHLDDAAAILSEASQILASAVPFDPGRRPSRPLGAPLRAAASPNQSQLRRSLPARGATHSGLRARGGLAQASCMDGAGRDPGRGGAASGHRHPGPMVSRQRVAPAARPGSRPPRGTQYHRPHRVEGLVRAAMGMRTSTLPAGLRGSEQDRARYA